MPRLRWFLDGLPKIFGHEIKPQLHEWYWLMEHEIIVDPLSLPGEPQVGGRVLTAEELGTFRGQIELKDLPGGGQAAAFNFTPSLEITRILAAALRERHHDAVVVGNVETDAHLISPRGKNAVVSVVLNELPVPSADTAWEKIRDIRNDNEMRERYYQLKRWMGRVARSDASASEIVDEIKGMLSDYRQHMKVHRLNAQVGTLKAIIIGTAEIIENLASLRFSKIADRLFSIGQQRMDLLKAELSAPGREVAYIQLLASKVR
jgi:hypothetical protein